MLDWKSLFVPTLPLLEVFLRGTVMYLALFVMLRVIMKRETGEVGIADLLVTVLIADAAQNAMAGGYTSITEGLLLVATIIFWSYAIEWVGYHFPPIARLISSNPLILVDNGEMVRKNMRRELITKEELMGELRTAGIEDLEQVKRVFLEPNGKFSIIRKDQEEPQKEVNKSHH